MNIFQKSDIGAQAAWKGFSSQTLYIASRLISDEAVCWNVPIAGINFPDVQDTKQ